MSRFRFGNTLPAQFAEQGDLLGPLRDLVGLTGSRTWVGSGFNMIWRPNYGGQSGSKTHFLQLMFMDEQLSFEDFTGTGVVNRGFLQNDIVMGGIDYRIDAIDGYDGSGQHHETGQWLNVPQTSNPAVGPSLVRQCNVPHGTVPRMQGVATELARPVFPVLSTSPFPFGQPGNPISFLEQDLSKPSTSRSDLVRVATLDQAHLDDPNLFLADATICQTITHTTQLTVATDDSVLASSVGEPDNITFLHGVGSPPTGGPNGETQLTHATFWIEDVQGVDGPRKQLQYSQMVLLHFNDILWPHATVATLAPIG